MSKVSIIREPDDPIAEVRISLGAPPKSKDFYIVFRGQPEKVIDLLENALEVAKHTLPKGLYEDHRGNQQ
jgi:hypothetical protein